MAYIFLIIIIALFLIKGSAVRKGFIQKTQEIKESGKLSDYNHFHIKVNNKISASFFVTSCYQSLPWTKV